MSMIIYQKRKKMRFSYISAYYGIKKRKEMRDWFLFRFIDLAGVSALGTDLGAAPETVGITEMC